MKKRFVLQTDIGPDKKSPVKVWDNEKKVVMATFPMEDRELATKLASVITMALNENPPTMKEYVVHGCLTFAFFMPVEGESEVEAEKRAHAYLHGIEFDHGVNKSSISPKVSSINISDVTKDD